MAAPLEFYFDFSSPYSYLAAHRVGPLAESFGRTVLWRPFLLGAVFKVTGAAPLVDIPLKRNYVGVDLARSARYLDLPYRHPDPFPFSAVAPSRAVYWTEETAGAEVAAHLGLALFDAAYGGRPISAAETVVEIGAQVGLDGAALQAGMSSQPIKDRLRAEVDRAIARNVFGAPFIFVDDEPFWGNDRFDQLRWRLGGSH